MCWSFEISVATASAEIALCLVLFFRQNLPWAWVRSSPRDRYYVYLFSMVVSIEILEIFMWYSINNDEGCGLMNTVATSLAYLVIICQPLITVSTLYLSSAKGRDQDIFFLPMLLCVVTTLMWAVEFVWSWIHEGEQEACAYVGPNSHLTWRWYLKSWYNIMPNFYPYVLNVFVPILFYKPRRVAGSIWVVLVGSVAASLFTVSPNEICSTWCFGAMALLVYFFAEPYIWWSIGVPGQGKTHVQAAEVDMGLTKKGGVRDNPGRIDDDKETNQMMPIIPPAPKGERAEGWDEAALLEMETGEQQQTEGQGKKDARADKASASALDDLDRLEEELV